MTGADQQAPLAFRGEPVHVDLRDVDRQPTGHAAIALCATRAGKLDKVVAADIGVQDAVWSRVKTGQNNLILEQLATLMHVCGNEAPLQWLLLRMGYDPRSLRKLESETERKLRETQEELAALRAEHDAGLRAIQRIMRGAA